MAKVDDDAEDISCQDVSFGSVNTPGFSVEDDSGAINLDGLASASLAEASLRQIPEKVEEMALSKMLP
eukprot:4112193-Amphidinium_carterae.2